MRLIDADALIEFIDRRFEITWKDDYEGGIKDACVDILDAIDKTPSIDIVRCKECKHRDKEHSYMCTYLNDIVFDKGDGFCCNGERECE